VIAKGRIVIVVLGVAGSTVGTHDKLLSYCINAQGCAAVTRLILLERRVADTQMRLRNEQGVPR
jgi:hypothetical protein